MRLLIAALLLIAPLALLGGCSSGEVQSSDVEDYKKAGLPSGGAKPSADETQAER